MGIEFALGALFFYGITLAVAKKSIEKIGRVRAIAYNYVALSLGAIIIGIALGIDFSFPVDLIPSFALEVVMGAVGVIAAYKALEAGKASVVSPITKTYAILTLFTSVIILSEPVTVMQMAGAMIVIVSSIIIAIDFRNIRIEEGMKYMVISILARTYYFTFIKDFVNVLGPIKAIIFLESGIMAFIIIYYMLKGRDLSIPDLDNGRYSYISGAAVAIGSLFYGLSVKEIGAGLTVAISSGGPIVNCIISYLLLKEKLELQRYAAIVLIVLGLLIINSA